MNWIRNRRPQVAALLVAALAAGPATPARADVDDSRKCRISVGKDIPKVTNLGLKGVDKCFKLQHKAVASVAPCVDLGSQEFDPTLPSGKRKYEDIKAKTAAKVPLKCLVGDPVLANYQSGDAYADNLPLIEETIVGNTVLTAGLETLGDPDTDPQAKIDGKCIETIQKNRTKIFKEIWVASQKCQKLLDDVATSFGPLDAGCLSSAPLATPIADEKITKDCITKGASAAAGACFPLPSCVVDSSITAAQTLIKAAYSTQPPPPPVCGNGTVEPGEQCDPPGAACSATCELLGPSCDAVPGSSVIGSRTVTVSVDSPNGDLAGVQITLDYPQFQAGVPGTGQSSIVQGAVSVLQGTAGDYISIANDRDTDMTFVIGSASNFIASGPLFSVAMDACVAKETNFCNRNQNVVGCCDAATDGDGDATFQECADFAAPPVCPAGSFPAGSIGAGSVEDCCPGDNACVTQAAATLCSVSGAVDSSGTPVDGVTCSVSISGT